jgi:hypothetical protein
MTEGGQSLPDRIELKVLWPETLAAEAQVVNQALFVCDQESQDVVYFVLGHVAPPLWLTPDAARERLGRVGNEIHVQPRGSFLMSRKRAEDMWEALGKHLGKLPRD